MAAPRFYGSTIGSELVAQRREMVTRSMSLLRQWGYEEADVPLLTPYDEIEDAFGRRSLSDFFLFPDREGRMLMLRGDITPVLASMLAPRMGQVSEKVQAASDGGAVPSVQRVCYANRIARVQRNFAREQLESYGVGLELVGASGERADLEVLTLALEMAEALELGETELHLGHVGIAEGLFDELKPTPAQRELLRRALAHRDPQEMRSACVALRAPEVLRVALQDLCKLGAGEETLERVATLGLPEVNDAIENLRALYLALRTLAPEQAMRLDLAAYDERGYYTGMHFSLYQRGLGLPIGGGGRYDRLFTYFGVDAPSVGFGLRIDRLLEARAQHSVQASAPPGAPFDECTDTLELLRKARELRRQGLRFSVPFEGTPEGADSKGGAR